MAEPTTDLLEIVLADVAAARAEPWYPADYARATGVPRDQLDACLDRLRLSGLVQLTDWVQGRGQGYTITPQGEQVLDSPRLLARLREGRELPRRLEAAPPGPSPATLREPGTTWDRGEAIRAALLDQSGPAVTKALIWVNVAVFAYGLWLASQQQVANQYLGFSANPQVLQIQHNLGGLAPFDLQNGQWWRLLSYCFVHGGLIHILMNMYVLYSIGSLVEKMWGAPRYLALYLIAGLGGGVLHLYVGRGGLMVGASGSICGLLGSMGVWVWLNRHFLPPRLVSDWMRNIMVNVVLISLLSVPGLLGINVSWEGHLGGGLAGAVVAVPLNYSRFGRGAQRWLGWAGVAAVPVLSLGLLIQPGRGNPAQPQVDPDNPDVVRLRKDFGETLFRANRLVQEAYREHGRQFLEKRNNPRKDPEATQKAAAAFADAAREVKRVSRRLETEGRFENRAVRHFVTLAQAYLAVSERFCTEFAESLSPVDNWTEQRQASLNALWLSQEVTWGGLQATPVYQHLLD